jgi:hypothetical protein
MPDHGARGEHLDLELATGHVVNLLGEVAGVLVEDVLRRPGRLEAHRGRAGRGLAPADHRECERGCTGGAREEIAA